MSDAIGVGPWKLLLCIHKTVKILSFITEEAANEAEEFYSGVGWHTCVVRDEVREEEEEPSE